MITSTWKALDPDVQQFLLQFERRAADPDSDNGDQFAEQFIVSDPHHEMTLTREAFVASLPQRRSLFEAAGIGSAHCVAASQLDLGGQHVLLTTDWEAAQVDRDPLDGSDMIRLISCAMCARTSPSNRIAAATSTFSNR